MPAQSVCSTVWYKMDKWDTAILLVLLSKHFWYGEIFQAFLSEFKGG